MTTPTLREALARISVALEEAERNGLLPYSLEGLWEMADEALAAKPELPEPVAHLKKNGFKFNADIEPDDYETEVKLYTAAQLQQAVEQKEKASDEWRRLALQFDGHRMQSLGWLKAILKELPEDAWPFARTFVSAPPLSGEQVLADRIAAQPKREPMSEIGLAIQTEKFYPPDEALASAIYMQAWRDAEAHHNIGDK